MRNKLQSLWFSRASVFWREAIRYLQIILTGYMFLPIMLLVLLAFLYHYLINEWAGNPYIHWVLAALLTLIVNGSRIRTFILPADSIHLLPVEEEMNRRFFHLSWIYSWLIRSIILFVLMLVLSPLYYGMIADDPVKWRIIYGVLVFCLSLQLYAGFQEHRIRKNGVRLIHIWIRWILQFLFLSWLLDAYVVTIFAWVGLFVLFTLYYVRLAKKRSWNWTLLVGWEQAQLLRFYRFVGLFMNVPQISARVKKRKWIIYAAEKLTKRSRSAYSFLFLRSLIRYEDLFTLYYRLLIIAGICLYAVPQRSWSILLFFSFLIANGLQLAGSWRRIKAYFWDSIYPLSFTEKAFGFSRTVFWFLLFQVVSMSVILIFSQNLITAFVVCLIGAVVSYLYTKYVLFKQLQKTVN